MINLKLKTIASFISKEDVVLDTCCDHAYLAIYLKQNHLCEDVFASDINENALNGARKNIQDSNLEISTYLSDGFKNISNPDINTVIIAGVGANTVLEIIDSAPLNIQKFIISSNNHQELLRKTLNSKQLYIQDEKGIFDKGKYYVIMMVTKEYKKENRVSLKYGTSRNKEYFSYLIKKEQEVLKKIPKYKIWKRIQHQINLYDLKKIIKRI